MANKKIIDLVRAKKASMAKNPGESGQNLMLAIAAMKAGMGSPAWRAYMIQFVEQSIPGVPVDPRQLERLMGNDETKDLVDMDRKRAYILSNAPCTEQTRDNFDFTVESIDEGIAASCSPTAGTASTGPKTGRTYKKGSRKGSKKSPKK
jgi:hypothetical protein